VELGAERLSVRAISRHLKILPETVRRGLGRLPARAEAKTGRCSGPSATAASEARPSAHLTVPHLPGATMQVDWADFGFAWRPARFNERFFDYADARGGFADARGGFAVIACTPGHPEGFKGC